MKKTIAILLIGVLAGNAILYLFFFQFLINSLKGRFEKDTKELLEKVNQVIEIDESEYSAIEFIEQKEFYYKGGLYDLIEQKKEGNKITLLCYRDKEEENAIEEKDDFINKTKSENLIQFNFFSYTAVFHNAKPDYYSYSLAYKYRKLDILYSSVVPEIPNPPPRMIS